MSGPGEFYESLRRTLQLQPRVAVATIVHTRGSSPREVGARMLVTADGATDGTVGGGCGEAEVWRTALEVLADDQPRMVMVDLTNDIGLNTDGVCGGIMDIFVEPWTAIDSRNGDDVVSAALEAIQAHKPAIVATVLKARAANEESLGQRMLIVGGECRAGGLNSSELEASVLGDAAEVLAGARSQLRTYEQTTVYFDLALPRPTLIVVGAGHVAVPIAQVGRLLDFEVVVIDDRAAFATEDRFPTADRVIVDDFEAALESLSITSSTYVVLVTRGHAHDVRILRKLVQRPTAYLGMIGSRRRVFAVFKLLRDEAVPIEDLLRVHAPIGLDIKTETPGEIAVSVGAELLKVRRGGDAASISELLRPQYAYSLARGAQDVS